MEPSKAPEPFLKPYNPAAEEPKMLTLWEKSGYANPDNLPNATKGPYSIVLPPPNVTGTLHMGHAAMLAIEDILIRYHRMRGYKTLWLPGTDSAAIATQSKVETEMYKKEKLTRHDIGRDELMKRIDAFVEESKATIIDQTKKMGSSLDWSRYAYTMDEKRYTAVMEAFVRMYDAGLIYRGDRIVNWDPKSQTTVSDDEIEYVEQKDPFYHFKYGPFDIGTVRPETKFGDKYVVMHPDDERYKKFKHGEKIDLEWINGPITATIIKDEAADMSFGSGAMTITPAHSAIDFEIAQRHGLDIERVIDDRGILLDIAGEFKGQHIKKARAAIVEKLKLKGLIVKTDENYVHNVATNYRGGGIIEPQIKRQWFVAVNKTVKFPDGKERTLKEWMREAVESGGVRIMPERFEKIYYHWIDNLRDWCISRQIWFGHRIPVWYCLNCKHTAVNNKIKNRWFFVRHGETDANKERIIDSHTDIPLNEEGKAQARRAGEKLKNQNIELIISSNFGRCKETASIISETTGAEVIFDAELRERFYGDAEGLTYEEAKEKFDPHGAYETANGNIETIRSLEERVYKAFAHHKNDHGHKNVVIVSHGGAIRWLLKRIKNLTFEEVKSHSPVGNAEVLSLDVLETACEKCGNDLFEQDPDTLDTWFSSGLWTFSTLGWPEKTRDLETYHPTAVLETGYDILFFWVARMILMSGFLLGDVPFRKVYLHGLVRDEKGRKMSKSLGNVIDPLVMTEKYGADAARLSLVIGAAPGNDVKLSEDRVRGYKHFANKIWNISRFILENSAGADAEFNADDSKLVGEAHAVATQISEYIDTFRLDLAADAVYHFVWHRFADEIIEASKPVLKEGDAAARASKQRMLYEILIISLKLLHPFMPFVTEAIWQQLPTKENDVLMVAQWPNN